MITSAGLSCFPSRRKIKNQKKETTTMKRLMKTIVGVGISARTLVSLLAAAAAFGMSGTALAGDDSQDSTAQVCSNQTLHNSYVFAAQGFNIVNGAAQPKAILEGMNFNGDGTLSIPFVTVSINGSVNHFPPGTGVYTVQANCQGTITVNNGPSFDIFVRPSAKTFWLIQTDSNTVLQGTAIKVPGAP
ncbi:MAG: hypothetical protein ACR2MW_03615 [Chthoniobacterales bacterium]